MFEHFKHIVTFYAFFLQKKRARIPGIQANIPGIQARIPEEH